MEKLKAILRIISVTLVGALVLTGVCTLEWKPILGKTACFFVAATSPSPSGFAGYIDTLYSDFVTENQPSNTQNGSISTVIVPEYGGKQEDIPAVSTSIDQQVMGNIIKKTLTPYNVKKTADNVYINNKIGAAVNAVNDIASPLEFTVTKSEQPQILIYHTHTTESFMNNESEYYTNRDEPRSTEASKNMVSIGKIIADELTAAGYSVVHDTTLHDHPGFSGSYSRSAETVKKWLEKYPSIKIAIDVHRDSISSGKSDKIAPVVNINGKEAAQVMLVMGSETGGIKGYPKWRENLKLAVKLQYIFEATYPQFARSMLLKSAKYNQDLITGSFLIEIGSDANTFEQANYSAELVGKSLVVLLDSQ